MCGDRLVEVLKTLGPDRTVDIDHACLCETMDMIGLFGFGHEFNALRCNIYALSPRECRMQQTWCKRLLLSTATPQKLLCSGGQPGPHTLCHDPPQLCHQRPLRSCACHPALIATTQFSRGYRMFGEGKHERMMGVMLKSELEVQRRLQDPLRRWVAPFTKVHPPSCSWHRPATMNGQSRML